MSYVFENETIASSKFEKGNKLTLNNISGTINDANVIVNGVQALLHIGSIEDRYNPEDAARSVKQNVNIDE